MLRQDTVTVTKQKRLFNADAKILIKTKNKLNTTILLK